MTPSNFPGHITCDETLPAKRDVTANTALITFTITKGHIVDGLKVYNLPTAEQDDLLSNNGDLYCIDYLNQNGELIYRRNLFIDFACVLHAEPGGCIAGDSTGVVTSLPYYDDVKYITIKFQNDILATIDSGDILHPTPNP